MSRKYKIRNQEEYYFVTFTVIDWIDVFTRQEYRDIFLESIRYCQKEKGLLVGAWVIMTNHIHMVIGTNGQNRLEDIVRDLKSFTSRQIRKAIEGNQEESRKLWLLDKMTKSGVLNANNKSSQLWQQYYHPIELSSAYLVNQKIVYIHDNPVRAGFVHEPSDWLYSSAIDYEADGKGMIKLVCLK